MVLSEFRLLCVISGFFNRFVDNYALDISASCIIVRIKIRLSKFMLCRSVWRASGTVCIWIKCHMWWPGLV